MTIKLNLSENEANMLIDAINLAGHSAPPDFIERSLKLAKRIEVAVEKKKRPQRIYNERSLSSFALLFLLAVLPVTAQETTPFERPEVFACEVAQDAVRSQLKAPLTARFQSCREGLPGGECLKKKTACLGQNKEGFSGSFSVDAQNAFGVYLRSKYVFSVKVEGRGPVLDRDDLRLESLIRLP